MMTTSAPDRVRDFIAEVAHHFPDLSDAERGELLDDLEQHLAELAADDPAALEHELVDPAQYAAELRRSAGLVDLEQADSVAASSRVHRIRGLVRARVERVRGLVRERVERVGERPAAREVRDFLPHLRPAWWVVRGWVLAVAAAQLTVGGPWWRHVPVPDRHVLGLLVALAAIAVSVRLGRDHRDRTRTWRAVDVAARVVLVVGVFQAITSGMATEYVTVSEAESPWQPPVLRHPDGEPITNLYLFDGDGDPVEDVFVYDGVGRPVEIGELDEAGFEELDTVYRRGRDGTPLRNRYPLDQYVVEYDEPAAGAGAYAPDREPRTAPDVVLPGDVVRDEDASSPPSPPTEAPSSSESGSPTDAATEGPRPTRSATEPK